MVFKIWGFGALIYPPSEIHSPLTMFLNDFELSFRVIIPPALNTVMLVVRFTFDF